jgi:hypothetical protein
MLKTSVVALALVNVLSTVAVVAAQTKSVPGEMMTVTATVQAVELQSRTLTLRKSDGTYATFIIPAAYERFSGIKVGDTVTVRYYDNVVFRKLNPGEKPVNTDAGGITKAAGDRPSGTAATQRTMTTKITAIDQKIPSITFTGPNNWTYSTKVNDRDLLKTLSVGDLVNVTWTEAVSVDVAPPKK